MMGGDPEDEVWEADRWEGDKMAPYCRARNGPAARPAAAREIVAPAAG